MFQKVVVVGILNIFWLWLLNLAMNGVEIIGWFTYITTGTGLSFLALILSKWYLAFSPPEKYVLTFILMFLAVGLWFVFLGQLLPTITVENAGWAMGLIGFISFLNVSWIVLKRN